jgi:hypothetical protein
LRFTGLGGLTTVTVKAAFVQVQQEEPMKSGIENVTRLLGSVVFTAAASLSHASLVTNGSFELGSFGGGVNGNESLAIASTAMTGWTVITDSISWLNGNAFSLAPFSGDQFLDLTDANDTGVSGRVTQTIATVAGSNYLLTRWLGSTTLYPSENANAASAGSTTATFTGAAPTSFATWTQCYMAFTATGSTTAISLQGAGATGYQFLGLDNVNVELVPGGVPEPGSLALPMLGLAGSGVVSARRPGKPPSPPGRHATAPPARAG